MKTIMAIGAHIGDMELTCGAVLATRSLEGDHVVTVALTAGEKGNPPDMTVADYRHQKEREAREFMELLGGSAVVLPYADGELRSDDDVKYAVCDVIREHKPDVLITHWAKSIHKDHTAAHSIVHDSQYYAALPGFERELPPHFAAGPYYAENWEDPFDFTPTVYFGVSQAGFDLWSKAIELHWFALNSTSFRYRDYYTHLISVRGIEARREYAQAFDVPPMSKRSVIDEF